jgi:phosphoglycolate phosphatase-like HAD superfamily hydrolase
VIRVALFDIDGTLLLTAGAGRRAFIEALRETAGYDAEDQPFDFAGRTDLEIFSTLLARAGIPRPDAAIRHRFWKTYLAILDRELATMDGGGLCPGVLELLDVLHGDPEFRVGLVTGNIEEAAHKKLARFGIDSPFAFGAYGSDNEDRDRLVSIARARAEAIEGRPITAGACVVIGDTLHDIRCARAGGARVLAVATGFYESAALAAAKPDLLLDDLSRTGEVHAALRELSDPPPQDPATPHRGG